jgi:pimeloyl-ACP methyl ester carboxylesterase
MLLAFELSGPESAPSIVLIHGITETRESWRPVIDRLADRRVLAVDLRGHGASEVAGPFEPLTYASDVIETMQSVGIEAPDVVGHSLGGVVASAVAALGGATRVVNTDQPLRLASFKDGLSQLEPLLRGDEASFQQAIAMLFESMNGPLSDNERARIGSLRQARQAVVLGTWASVFDSTPEELDATVAQLASAIRVPYLSLHGIDPGDEYADWLTSLVPTANVEVWPDHGHYPHLIDPDRYVARLREFLAND